MGVVPFEAFHKPVVDGPDLVQAILTVLRSRLVVVEVEEFVDEIEQEDIAGHEFLAKYGVATTSIKTFHPDYIDHVNYPIHCNLPT